MATETELFESTHTKASLAGSSPLCLQSQVQKYDSIQVNNNNYLLLLLLCRMSDK